MDTLALGYTLPAIGRVTDLHRLENVRAGRTEKRLCQNGEFWRSLFSCIRIDKMQGIEGEATPPFIFNVSSMKRTK